MSPHCGAEGGFFSKPTVGPEPGPPHCDDLMTAQTEAAMPGLQSSNAWHPLGRVG